LRDESAYELYLRGQELLVSRNPAQAAVVLERARRQEPTRSSIREALGRAYYASGNYRRAVEEFSVVVDLYPTNHYAHYCLARSARQLGEEKLSRRHFQLARAMGYEFEV
jgi:Flp pilus assembly protein TadD